MKTWRERLSEDRAAGTVSVSTKDAWCNPRLCPVGMGVAVFGLDPFSIEWPVRWDQVNGGFANQGFSGRFHQALFDNDFDKADRILDEIDDRVLELKREMTV